jgi:hypothetical protein
VLGQFSALPTEESFAMSSAAPLGAQDLCINKLDAARRQLQTAITLWFTDGDPVSTHALAFAAYEIIHTVSKKRDRRDLLFDSDLIKDEYRSEFNKALKRHANFFKHADRDADSVIEFDPTLSEWFVLFAILGLELLGDRKSTEEVAFVRWLHIHRPDILTPQGKQALADLVPAENLAYLQSFTKRDFFEGVQHARRLLQTI